MPYSDPDMWGVPGCPWGWLYDPHWQLALQTRSAAGVSPLAGWPVDWSAWMAMALAEFDVALAAAWRSKG